VFAVSSATVSSSVAQPATAAKLAKVASKGSLFIFMTVPFGICATCTSLLEI